MRPHAIIDANVLIDYKDEAAGERHERAAAIVLGIDGGEPPSVDVTDYVLLESQNWIHERRRHDIAVDLYHRLAESAGFELVHSPQTDFHRAVALFETYDTLAFGDATIVAHMEREDIEYLYSFDGDFDAVDGVHRLDTPSDPFA